MSINRLFCLGVIFVVGILTFSLGISFEIIEPGYGGIKIAKLGKRGASNVTPVSGLVTYVPIMTKVIEYPIHMQRVVWSSDKNEGKPLNEEISFNTSDAVSVALDVAVGYVIIHKMLPEFYTEFRCDDIDTFTGGYLRDTVRNAFTSEGAKHSFDDLNGNGKSQFIKDVTNTANKDLNHYGVEIRQLGIVGSLRPPESLREAINLKTKAVQQAIQVENELRSATAEAKKKVAAAQGEAKANEILMSSLNQRLIDWEDLKIRRRMVERWNGAGPSVVAGNQGLMLNVSK